MNIIEQNVDTKKAPLNLFVVSCVSPSCVFPVMMISYTAPVWYTMTDWLSIWQLCNKLECLAIWFHVLVSLLIFDLLIICCRMDQYAVLKYPLTTESAMKKIEDNNTLVFIVHKLANKPQIKLAVKKLYDIDVAKINTLNRWVLFVSKICICHALAKWWFSIPPQSE